MPKIIKQFIIVGSVIFLVVLAYGSLILYLSWPISVYSVAKAGVFGDSFGLLTSLFSGLAFAGIILTVISQNKELKLQREELQNTREELRLTREEFEKQNSTLKKQNFESTFFQMMRLHHEIVGQLKLLNVRNQPAGRDCFETVYHELAEHHTQLAAKSLGNQGNSIQVTEELIDGAYVQLLGKYQKILGHYFRNLFTLLKFVKTNDVENKLLYSNIVRSQLSDYELVMLFYNCLSKFGKEKFKPMAEEFALFNNLPQEKLFRRNHIDLYNQSAFGDMGA